MSFKISLAGDLGSGKSTVAKIITERTGATYYATGAIMREVARRYGMDIAEFNVYAETHPETDREIDDGLVRLSDDPRDLIIDSRMAWHFTKNTFRVYMTTEPEISAARIMAAKRDVESFGSLEETAAQILRRRASEKKRYQELYGVDLTDLTNYTLIIDTSYATPEEVAEVILSSLAAWQADPSARFCEICASRLMRPLDGAAGEGEPTVFFENNRFCLTAGLDCAERAVEKGRTFVSCRLVPGSADGRGYTKFENGESTIC